MQKQSFLHIPEEELTEMENFNKHEQRKNASILALPDTPENRKKLLRLLAPIMPNNKDG